MNKKITSFLTFILLMGATSTHCDDKQKELVGKLKKLNTATEEYSKQSSEFSRALHTESEQNERKKLKNKYKKVCKNFKKCIKFIAKNPKKIEEEIFFFRDSRAMAAKPFMNKKSYLEAIKKCVNKYKNSKKDCKKAFEIFYNSYSDLSLLSFERGYILHK